jgi:hypothetical protein
MKSSTLDNILGFLSGVIILGVCVYYILDIKKHTKKGPPNTNDDNDGDDGDGDKTKSKDHPKCPDYFEIGDNDECINVKNLGKCRGTYNFDKLLANYADVFRNDEQKNKLKCEWAKSCDVAWSGVDRLC